MVARLRRVLVCSPEAAGWGIAARAEHWQELGFLHPHPEREDFGKITHEGRYRVWKEIWMLNYLGRSARYK